MTKDECFTAVLLAVGPLPHPEQRTYEGMFGGGFGTDMLSDDERNRINENVNYQFEVDSMMAAMGRTIEEATEFIDNQRKGDGRKDVNNPSAKAR